MANYSSKPAFGLAAIKAAVIIMAILIALGLGAIAAKLILDAGVSGAKTAGNAANGGEYPRVVWMAGAGAHVVMVIERPSGEQLVRVLDPETGQSTDRPLELD